MTTEKEEPKQPKKITNDEKIRKKGSDWSDKEVREKIIKLEAPDPWPEPPPKKKSED